MSSNAVVLTPLEKLRAFCRMGPLAKIPLDLQMDTSTDKVVSPLEKTLLHAFPKTQSVLGHNLWNALMKAFFANYKKTAIYFWLFPKGLIEFVQETHWDREKALPFLLDLLHFEWLEIEVCMLPVQEIEGFYPQGDLMQDVLFMNPDHRLATYTYPVFKTPLSLDLLHLGSYSVLCFRPLKTEEVRCIPLSPFYRHVIDHVVKGELTGKMAIQKTAEAFSLPATATLYEEGRVFFQMLLSQEALLGVQT